MKYQLIVQFPTSSVDDFDRIVTLEETLRGTLKDFAEVEGHDFGSGEFNIFVHTDEPKDTFERIREVFSGLQPERQMRAAFRDFDEEEYPILWPPNLKEFKVV